MSVNSFVLGSTGLNTAPEPETLAACLLMPTSFPLSYEK